MKAVRFLAAASALAVLAQPAIAPAQETKTLPDTQDHKLTLARVFASPSLDGPTPRLPKLSPDGRYLAYHLGGDLVSAVVRAGATVYRR